MYVVLSGAKCNLGDFLITERAVALLQALRPEREIHVLPGWEPLDPASDLLRSARAIVIAGGPGYQPHFHPRVYPLAERLAELPCPVVPLGLGWKGIAGDEFALGRYRFSPASLQALQWMSAQTDSLGCRDPLTAEVLRRHGIENTSMVGCPVWYDFPSLGREVARPAQIDRVVFTPAQLHGLKGQSVEVARRIAALWPSAERICSFHRGLERAGRWLPEADVANNREIAAAVAELGFRVADVTGDLAEIGFYDDCTLHVGYRVHAHLYFLSKRKPSLLLEEDGRGAGMSRALGLAGVAAFTPSPLGQRLQRGLAPRLSARASRFAPPYRLNRDAPAQVEAILQRDAADRFERFGDTAEILDAHFECMKKFVRGLP